MRKGKWLIGVAILVCSDAGSAWAQGSGDTKTAEGNGEIIVTARKRDETSIAVPVAVTAVSGVELDRRAVTNLDTIARSIPQLIIGSSGQIQGGNVVIRGIGSPETNPFADQAVSFNVDGVQVARSSVRRMSEFDIQQVEVLKGPQALFFGKNSPGGVISIRTADPTNTLTAKISTLYEFNAQEFRTEGYISAPLGETLGVRVAGYGAAMRGWIKSVIPEDALMQPNHRHTPRSREYGGRLTLKWNPSDRFDANLKVNYGHVKGPDSTATIEFINCPFGSPQSGGVADECRANNKNSESALGPTFGLINPIYGDGKTYAVQNQALGALTLNYDLSDQLKLTSVSGYYWTKLKNLSNYTFSYIPNGPSPVFAVFNGMRIRELTEEVRLASDFDGPVNFTVGGLIQDSRASTGSTTYRNAITPIYTNSFLMKQKGSAWSLFGQLMVKPIPELELSAGGRYSHEKKRIPDVRQGSAANPTPAPIQTAFDHSSFNDFSPEFSVTYRPTSALTVYGSYKEGFLSGGFNSGAGNFRADQRFGQETIRGFEGGIKAALFDRRLRTNLSVYSYRVKGLQVAVNVQDPVSGITFQTIRNAGSVRIKGAEFDFNYRSPIEGLSLHGALAYNHGRYTDYTALCYRGQTRAMGCNLEPNALGNGTAQDLSGTELMRAPKWTGNAGFLYDIPVNSAMKVSLSGDASFSGSFLTDGGSNPLGRQSKYTLLDGSVGLADLDDKWSASLIGRNLTDKHYFSTSGSVPFTGSPAGGVTGVAGDLWAPISRGREIILKLSYAFR